MLIKPPALKPGDKVAIVSLSGGILGEKFATHQRELGCARIKTMGLVPVMMPNTLKGSQFLAAHPEARAQDLKTAFADPDIKGIIAVIGGDDTYRLLPFLMTDHYFIHNVQAHPKLFTGFSDTTINHLMLRRIGMQSFYGPNFLNDLAELDHEMLPYTKAAFLNYFQNKNETAVLSSPVWYEERQDFSPAAVGMPRVAHPESKGYETVRGSGKVRGRLLGGCLDSFYDILTTTRYPDEQAVAEKYRLFPRPAEWQDKILFIETSEEKPEPGLYRKMLQILKQHQVFSAVRAILVGKPQDETYYETYKQILLAETAAEQLPILMNVNFGHAYPRTVLPYEAQAEIDFDEQKLTIVEPFFAAKIADK
ncbi:S66 peptidase family protein [Pediococcus siamensis]|uniref:S66 family peptidase n=1 Tax=Pediococcus siamensis TaxID=381829 RepID=UPI0039A163B4